MAQRKIKNIASGGQGIFSLSGFATPAPHNASVSLALAVCQKGDIRITLRASCYRSENSLEGWKPFTKQSQNSRSVRLFYRKNSGTLFFMPKWSDCPWIFYPQSQELPGHFGKEVPPPLCVNNLRSAIHHLSLDLALILLIPSSILILAEELAECTLTMGG